MSSYQALARSNYFRVKNQQAFAEALDGLSVELDEDDEGRVAMHSTDRNGGGWVVMVYDESLNEHRDVDMARVVAPHLCDGEVAVLMESGFEGCSFVHGFAVAINSAGERRELSLTDIYGPAAELGEQLTPVAD